MSDDTHNIPGRNGRFSARTITQRLRRHRLRTLRRRRRLPPASVVPALFTLGNLLAGFAAIHYAAKPHDFTGPYEWTALTFAGALIFLGMFFDAIDGFAARLTRSVSTLGAQLDSLADVVTFGVAPAFMMLRLVNRYIADDPSMNVIGPEADNALGKVLWGVAAAYVVCAALRLARFNVEVGPEFADHMSFRGLPSPGAAGAIASLVILHQHLFEAKPHGAVTMTFVRGAAFGIPLVTLLCALAMVSAIRYPHVLNRYLYGPRSFAYIVRLVIPLVLAIWWFQEMLAIVFTAYALSGPLGALARRRRGITAKAQRSPREIEHVKVAE